MESALIKATWQKVATAPLSGAMCSPQANDVYISDACSLHMIMGANMAGKTTLLKQTALLVIMAQIGCYVPATLMALRCAHRASAWQMLGSTHRNAGCLYRFTGESRADG